MAKNQYEGKIVGCWEVIKDSGLRSSSGSVVWHCRCLKCDRPSKRVSVYLRKGCQCENGERARKKFTTHGQSKTKLYRTWCAMRRRCKDPNFRDYKHYGARGVKVCKRWEDFQNFANDMGTPARSDFTLERKNFNDDYSLENCEWAPRKVQANNTRRNKILRYLGQEYTLAQLSELSSTVAAGVSYTLLRARLRWNWPLDEAMHIPPGGLYAKK